MLVFHNEEHRVIDRDHPCPGSLLRERFLGTADDHSGLPADWMKSGAAIYASRSFNWLWGGYSNSRAEVENMAAYAFARLPASRQNELLATEVPA